MAGVALLRSKDVHLRRQRALVGVRVCHRALVIALQEGRIHCHAVSLAFQDDRLQVSLEILVVEHDPQHAAGQLAALRDLLRFGLGGVEVLARERCVLGPQVRNHDQHFCLGGHVRKQEHAVLPPVLVVLRCVVRSPLDDVTRGAVVVHGARGLGGVDERVGARVFGQLREGPGGAVCPPHLVHAMLVWQEQERLVVLVADAQHRLAAPQQQLQIVGESAAGLADARLPNARHFAFVAWVVRGADGQASRLPLVETRDSGEANLGVGVDRNGVLLHKHALADVLDPAVAAILADLQAGGGTALLELERALVQVEELGGEGVHLRGAKPANRRVVLQLLVDLFAVLDEALVQLLARHAQRWPWRGCRRGNGDDRSSEGRRRGHVNERSERMDGRLVTEQCRHGWASQGEESAHLDLSSHATQARCLALRGGRTLFAHFETSAETSAVFGAHATSDQMRGETRMNKHTVDLPLPGI